MIDLLVDVNTGIYLIALCNIHNIDNKNKLKTCMSGNKIIYKSESRKDVNMWNNIYLCMCRYI